MRDFERDPTAHRAPRRTRTRRPRHGRGPRPFAPGRSPGAGRGLGHAPPADRRQRGRASRCWRGTRRSGSPVHDVVGSGGGSPLDAGVRSSMESAFGASFEDVRVHTDDRASKSAESVGANAYTVGSDVVFKGGQYNPATPTGQRTLAHELAHVVQQSQGPVDGTERRAASGCQRPVRPLRAGRRATPRTR